MSTADIDVRAGGLADKGEIVFPSVDLPRAPATSTVLTRTLGFAALILALFLLDQLALLLMNYWMLEGLGYESVFWTNFWMGAGLFALGFVVFTAAVSIPA